LNPFERLIVHEIAEELGFKHESKGEGKARYISVIYEKKSDSKPEIGLKSEVEVEAELEQRIESTSSSEKAKKKKKKKKGNK